MTNRVIILALLVIPMALGQYPPDGGPAWIGFVYGLPSLLALLILVRQRWAFMACVMYATIGLALDIATLVQGSGTLPERFPTPLIISAGANLLLITLAGREFMQEAWTPRSTRPPNPPPPPASGSA
jgi:hypothetical protein